MLCMFMSYSPCLSIAREAGLCCHCVVTVLSLSIAAVLFLIDTQSMAQRAARKGGRACCHSASAASLVTYATVGRVG